MSSTATSSKAGATFLWVLAAFVSFAVLFYVIQSLFAKQGAFDPRAPERLVNKEEILKAQNELVAKMGLNDPAKKAVVFDKTLETLKARPEGVSTQVVPGSVTQLKQAAAPAPDAAAPAPAAATPVPAPAPDAATPPLAPAPAAPATPPPAAPPAPVPAAPPSATPPPAAPPAATPPPAN